MTAALALAIGTAAVLIALTLINIGTVLRSERHETYARSAEQAAREACREANLAAHRASASASLADKRAQEAEAAADPSTVAGALRDLGSPDGPVITAQDGRQVVL